MITRDIICNACGHEGKIEAHDTADVFPSDIIFKILGKDPATGYLHFRCPQCSMDLAVDPLKVIGRKKIIGYSTTGKHGNQTARKRRAIPIVWGIVVLAFAIIIIAIFKGWWKYIAGGLLVSIGWGAIKTGLYASEKEINELTEPGPVSEDTKKKFQDRL